MTALPIWLGSLFFNFIYFGSFYLWYIKGIEGAGNLFVFFSWFTAITYIIVGLVANKSLFKHKRPVGYTTYSYIVETLSVFCLAWAGMFICATLYAIGFLLSEGSKTREKSIL